MRDIPCNHLVCDMDMCLIEFPKCDLCPEDAIGTCHSDICPCRPGVSRSMWCCAVHNTGVEFNPIQNTNFWDTRQNLLDREIDLNKSRVT